MQPISSQTYPHPYGSQQIRNKSRSAKAIKAINGGSPTNHIRHLLRAHKNRSYRSQATTTDLRSRGCDLRVLRPLRGVHGGVHQPCSRRVHGEDDLRPLRRGRKRGDEQG